MSIMLDYLDPNCDHFVRFDPATQERLVKARQETDLGKEVDLVLDETIYRLNQQEPLYDSHLRGSEKTLTEQATYRLCRDEGALQRYLTAAIKQAAVNKQGNSIKILKAREAIETRVIKKAEGYLQRAKSEFEELEQTLKYYDSEGKFPFMSNTLVKIVFSFVEQVDTETESKHDNQKSPTPLKRYFEATIAKYGVYLGDSAPQKDKDRILQIVNLACKNAELRMEYWGGLAEELPDKLQKFHVGSFVTKSQAATPELRDAADRIDQTVEFQ